MTRKQRALCAIEVLRDVIREPKTELKHVDAFQLLVAVMLSAQCTDARVNAVSPALFQRFYRVTDLASTSPDEILPFIASISYPNNKSRHLSGMAKMVVEDFGGRVPETVEELERLPGVGHKTAQVVASVAFGVPTLAVDTHIFRVANRIGIVSQEATNPLRVETELKRLFPREEWGDIHHYLILHGRYTCTARSPDCVTCPVARCCRYRDALDRLPLPLENLDARKGRYFCGTRGHYFNEVSTRLDRRLVEQIACPRCGSMNIFLSKNGRTTKRIRDFRV